MKLIRSACVVALAFAAIAGCQTVKISDKNIQEVTEKQVVEKSPSKSFVLVDVRKPEHFQTGHIPGAINIYLPEIRESDERLADAKEIIVYGDGWTDPLPTAGAKRLLSLKYGGVYLFRGGLEVWKAAGHGLVESSAPGTQRPETGG